MTAGQILLAIVTGLAVNECCDVSPWAARKVVRWSARRRYVPPAHAELRAEELAAYIDDRPGRLSKLITALCFAVAAVVTRKVTLAVAPHSPWWQPTMLTVPVHHEDDKTLERRHPKFRAMHQAWCQLTNEIRGAASELGVGSRSWRRCMKELRRITGDDRWVLVENNLDLLKKINNLNKKSTAIRFRHAGGINYLHQYSIPTDSTITHYQAAVETTRAEVRRLTSDFLFSSAPR